MRWLDDSTLQLQQSITMLGNENAPKLRKWPLALLEHQVKTETTSR
jgi:hypothetical protein